MAIFVNGCEVPSFNFPGGEVHVKIDPSHITDSTKITAELYNSDSIMQLLMVVDAVRQINPDTRIVLSVPYFPYARQDRVCNEGESFSLHVMTNLINSLNCNMVEIFDPHSEVMVSLLDNCRIYSMHELISKSFLLDRIRSNNLTLISPDKGAKYKVTDFGESYGLEVLCADKIRDSQTGNIIATEFLHDVSKKDCIILDDICDGGRTFIELAKVMREKGACLIYLYVTHGIFSKGLRVLQSHFDHVYCYHTMLPDDKIDNDFLTILEKEHDEN